ncbi:enoyl-CoA hydratase/isomerase family protein [Conyzicola nivalis]|uniref:Enoyl-CoA hydratase n=1 Tax=Conyzicola nivalis TaxID=1477021 RepID=A0A916WEL0_9MICO|nr:enoyl-CoA hydratase/isomerase family protein [Conyzicola nivalis]GGA90781.1 enoyl-CoA hydratase [Conyzicola nivalis]
MLNADMTQLTVTKTTPALWRVAFDNPPINLIGPDMLVELRALLDDAETDPLVAVIVFESADEEFFLAHWDIASDPELTNALPAGPTGFHPWLDILIRLSKLPAVTISAIRGRARGAGSEFALATDIRFASREKAVLGQFELGTGAVPGGGPSSRLPRLVGRGRALEILLSAGDYDGDMAERYGYVNRSIPDHDFEQFVSAFAERVSAFDVRAIQEVKAFVNAVSLPDDAEFPAQMDAFWNSVSRPETQDRAGQMFQLGLQQRGETELELGEQLEKIVVPPAVGRERS